MPTKPPPTIRRRVWAAVRDVGPLPVDGLALRLDLPAADVARACGELREAGFLRRLTRDDAMRYEVTVTPFDDQACDRRLRSLQRDADLNHEPPPAKPSAAAGRGTESGHGQRRAIVEYLKGHGDATRDELAEALGIDLSSICPRVDELLKARVVRVTDRKRRTRRGKPAGVLVLTGQSLLF